MPLFFSAFLLFLEFPAEANHWIASEAKIAIAYFIFQLYIYLIASNAVYGGLACYRTF
jgi:hypothetical protein